MKSISWENFDGIRFQKFCNSLLFQSVSRHAHLFSAPGADQGIDQYFHGAYDSKIGKWRFQDKYTGTSPSKSIATLRREIIQDIKDHFAGEDFIVYITNINLTKHRLEILLSTAETELNKFSSAHTEVLIWHHATLEAAITTFPLLYHWYWEPDPQVLYPYKEYFVAGLRTTDLGFQLKNAFIGREEVLEGLNSFLQSDQLFLAITGNSWIGKTRIVIQFFETVIDQKGQWQALVLMKDSLNDVSFLSLISSGKKYIIFVDDLREHLSQFQTIMTAVSKLDGNVKIVFTSLDNYYQQLRRLLPSHNHLLPRLLIKPLDSPEIRKMYQSLLPHLGIGNIIYLANKSSGIPGVILEYCQLIRNGYRPEDFSEQDGINFTVKRIIEDTLQFVEPNSKNETTLGRKIIFLLSLLGPFPSGRQGLELLAEFLETKAAILEPIVHKLNEFGLISIKENYKIKPDPFSDITLKEFYNQSPLWISEILTHLRTQALSKNIITNLSRAHLLHEIQDDGISVYINNYLLKLSNPQISDVEMQDHLDTINLIAANEEKVAIEAIRQFIECCRYRVNPFKEETLIDASILFSILMLHAKKESQLILYHELLEQFIDLTGHIKSIILSYHIREFDLESMGYRTDLCCYRQLFICRKIEKYFSSTIEWKRKIALKVFDTLWPLDYQLEEFFDKEALTYHGGQGFITECNHTREFRIHLLTGAISFYRIGFGSECERKEILKDICRVLLFMFEDPEKTKGPTINQDREVTIVVAFIEELLQSKLPAKEKAIIRLFLSFDRKRPIKASYVQTSERLKACLNNFMNIREELEYFLLTKDLKFAENEKTIERIISKHTNIAEFIEDLLFILNHTNLSTYTQLHSIIDYLGKYYLPEAKQLFLSYIEMESTYLSPFSTLAGYIYKDETFFYTAIQKLWVGKNKSICRRTALWLLLEDNRIKKGYARVEDLYYFSEVIEDNDQIAKGYLEKKLYQYASINEKRTFELMKRLVSNSRSVEEMIHAVCEDQAFSLEFYDEVVDFFWNCLDKVNVLSFAFNPALRLIWHQTDSTNLFEYILNALQKKKFMPDPVFYPFPRFQWEYNTSQEYCLLFHLCFSWLKEQNDFPDHIRKTLLQFFMPFQASPSEEFEQMINLCISEANTSLELGWLATAIQVNVPYDLRSLGWLCLISEKLDQKQSGDYDYTKLFGESFFMNIETSKSGRLGYPYIQDLQKQETLKLFLSKRQLPTSIHNFLLQALIKVEADIVSKQKISETI